MLATLFLFAIFVENHTLSLIELRHVEVHPQMDSELNRKVLNDENAKKTAHSWAA